LLVASTGCGDPVASTDLRPDGDPEVLSVLVMNDPDFFIETATFCAIGDEKRPGFVGGIGGNVCDDDLSVGAEIVSDATSGGAEPTGWYVRVMFDELLDPNIEDLVDVLDPTTMLPTGQFNGTLVNTQPFVLTCTDPAGNPVNVAYDGYYSPSGNSVTWPVGPSLVVQPIDHSTVRTGAACSLTLNDNIVDKQQRSVPADQRGAYQFELTALAFTGSSPAPGGKICADATTESCEVDDDCETGLCILDVEDQEIITPDAPLVVSFNGFIDAATLDAAEVTIAEVPVDADGIPDCSAAGTARTAIVTPDISGDVLSLNIAATVVGTDCEDADMLPVACAWTPSSGYVVTFNTGNEVADVAGGTGALPDAASFTLCFTTDVAP
jgi:hypothetical protein